MISVQDIVLTSLQKIQERNKEYFPESLSLDNSKKNCKKALNLFKENINCDQTLAIKCLVLAFSCHSDIVEYTYKENLFKPSTYDFACPAILTLTLESIQKELELPDAINIYISSILALHSFQSEVKKKLR